MAENYKKRTTRIKRRSIFEKTVVLVLAEDLQQRFDDMQDMGYEVATACEKIIQFPADPVLARELYILRQKRNGMAYQFWVDLRDRYNNWTDWLGVRDGYEVVTVEPQRVDPMADADQNPEF